MKGACELLGLDPLYVAKEGKLLVVVEKARSDKVLKIMRTDLAGRNSAIIGDVTGDDVGLVSMQTVVGGWRIVDMPVGEQLPRIC